jgi:hypothetical protein
MQIIKDLGRLITDHRLRQPDSALALHLTPHTLAT